MRQRSGRSKPAGDRRASDALARAQRQLADDRAALERLHEASSRLIGQDALPTLLQAIVDAAIDLTGARKGTLQLHDGAGGALRMAAQRGFERPFLEHFATMHQGCVSGEAACRRERVVVEDVSTSPDLAGTPSLAVMRAAGVRAVQCTPVTSRAGALLGILSTHHAEPHSPGEGTLRLLDLLAREAGSLIEARQREEALRESEALLRAIIETIADPVYVKDAESRLVLVNPATAAAVGKPAEAMLGRDDRELYDDPAFGEAILEHDRRVMETGTVHVFEETIPTPGGERVMLNTKAPRRDAAGRVIGVVGVARDITERIRAARRLAQLAEASLRVMRETDPRAMAAAAAEVARELIGARLAATGHVGADGAFVVEGTARAPDAPDAPGGTELLALQPHVDMRLVEETDVVRWTGEQLRADRRWRSLPEGHAPPRGLLAVRLVDRRGRANGMILVSDKVQGEFTAVDETVLRQLGALVSLAAQHVEARVSLEEANCRQREFLAVLSHELRNPLAPIRNSLHVLERATPGSEPAHRAQAVIDRQVGHLTRLVEDLLDVTRIAEGKIQLQRERVDLCTLVQRTVEDHRSVFRAHAVWLELHLATEPLWVDGDRTRLAQIVGNLLQNAAKFTPRDGGTTVVVRRDAAQGAAIVTVSDTGGGLAPELMPRLFEPFAQADRTLDRSKGGLGLGLSLVKRLVEMHGGSVRAESPAAGAGAVFTVALPLAGAGEVRPAPSGPRRRGGARRRVLVIEDNDDAAESLREVLELEEHQVELAGSGPEGLEKARAFGPDVVLCDIGLPGMDGYAVARALRADPRLGRFSLVALTGYAQPEDVHRATEAGFDAHLAKPPDPRRLEELLGELKA